MVHGLSEGKRKVINIFIVFICKFKTGRKLRLERQDHIFNRRIIVKTTSLKLSFVIS
ncbi:hypothetical protein Hanom_Chr00s000306g01634171 [Helianthus anomalus]